MLIRVLPPRFPGCNGACSRPCYRTLKHGFFVVGFSFLDGLLGLLVAVVAVVPGRDPSHVHLLQVVPQCGEGGVDFYAAVERVWAGKPFLLHESRAFRLGLRLDLGLLLVYNVSSLRQMCVRERKQGPQHASSQPGNRGSKKRISINSNSYNLYYLYIC